MLTKAQIEELGWAESSKGTYLFESVDEQYRCWVMQTLEDKCYIYGMPSDQPLVGEDVPGKIKYDGDVDSQMELYDIMVSVGVLPKEEKDEYVQ